MGKTRHFSPDGATEPEEFLDPRLTVTAPPVTRTWEDWTRDCLEWRGVLLEGRYAHWCPNWDHLPMDETCPEWPCQCGVDADIDGTPSSA